MNKLIIMAGASGAGKSFLLQQISEIDDNIVPIKKLSTRSARDYEKEEFSGGDLVFDCSVATIKEKGQFRYKYEKETYGIRKSDIDSSFAKRKIPFGIGKCFDENKA